MTQASRLTNLYIGRSGYYNVSIHRNYEGSQTRSSLDKILLSSSWVLQAAHPKGPYVIYIYIYIYIYILLLWNQVVPKTIRRMVFWDLLP